MQSFREMSALAPDCPETAPDAAAARAERRLALLEEMAEIGMNLLRRLGADGDPDQTGEIFAKVSRAVRLTLALEAKTDRELAGLMAGAAPAAAPASAEQDASRAGSIERIRNENKANAFDLLVALSESESETFDDLLDAIAEPSGARVETGSDYGPSRAQIERLCRDLGLSPELSSRVGEGWHAGYLVSRPRRNPFRQGGLAPPWPPAPA